MDTDTYSRLYVNHDITHWLVTFRKIYYKSSTQCFALAGLTRLKTAVEEIGYHNDGYQLSRLRCVFCLGLCAHLNKKVHSMCRDGAQNDPCERHLF